MTKEQVTRAMQGRTTKEIFSIGFTANSKIYSDRYDKMELDHTNGLVILNDGQEFWDYVDINSIVFRTVNENHYSPIQVNTDKLIGMSASQYGPKK